MSGQKRQKTLAYFGVTKKIKHRGENVPVHIPEEIDMVVKVLQCPKCKQRFKTHQGLGVHKLACMKGEDIASYDVPNQTPDHDDDLVITSQHGSSAENQESAEGTKKKVDGRKNCKGAVRRNKHTAVFMAKVIHECQSDVSQYVVATNNGISQSLVSKWLKRKNEIIEASTDALRKRFSKQRPSRKYLEVYRELFEKLKAARKDGKQVNFNWLWNKATTIFRTQTDNPNAIIKKHVITTFLKKYNVRMRARQRNRSKPKEAYREELMKWHLWEPI